MTKTERLLIRFARETIADETCQQGWRDPCGRPAAYESIGAGHLMCGACVRGWYALKDGAADEDPEWIADGLRNGTIRKTKTGYQKRIDARRRDDSTAESRLSTAAVDVLILLEGRRTRPKKP